MTAPTIDEDFMFDLDLRIIPVEESRENPLSPNASGGCIGSMGACSYTCSVPCSQYACYTHRNCPSYVTCRRCQ